MSVLDRGVPAAGWIEGAGGPPETGLSVFELEFAPERLCRAEASREY